MNEPDPRLLRGLLLEVESQLPRLKHAVVGAVGSSGPNPSLQEAFRLVQGAVTATRIVGVVPMREAANDLERAFEPHALGREDLDAGSAQRIVVLIERLRSLLRLKLAEIGCPTKPDEGGEPNFRELEVGTAAATDSRDVEGDYPEESAAGPQTLLADADDDAPSCTAGEDLSTGELPLATSAASQAAAAVPANHLAPQPPRATAEYDVFDVPFFSAAAEQGEERREDGSPHDAECLAQASGLSPAVEQSLVGEAHSANGGDLPAQAPRGLFLGDWADAADPVGAALTSSTLFGRRTPVPEPGGSGNVAITMRRLVEALRLLPGTVGRLHRVADDLIALHTVNSNSSNDLGANGAIRLSVLDLKRGAEQTVDELRADLARLQAVADSALAERWPATCFGEVVGGVCRQAAALPATQQKGAVVEVVGENVPVPAALAAGLESMVEQLLDNALSHGLESAGVRRLRDKPPQGRVVVSAIRRGGELLVEVRDDGRGLDLRAIALRAVALGWITPAEVELLNADQNVALVNRSGFASGSCLAEVAEKCSALNGSFKLSTQRGRGTTATLIFSDSVDVDSVVAVRSGERWFAFPSQSIVHCERLSAAPTRQGTPLARLIGEEAGDRLRSARGSTWALQLHNSDFLVLVDEVLPAERAVLIPLASTIRGWPMVLGVAETWRGEHLTLLAPAGVLGQARSMGDEARRSPQFDRADFDRRGTVVLAFEDPGLRGQLAVRLSGAGWRTLETTPTLLLGFMTEVVLADPILVIESSRDPEAAHSRVQRLRDAGRHPQIGVVFVGTAEEDVPARRSDLQGVESWVSGTPLVFEALLETLRRFLVASPLEDATENAVEDALEEVAAELGVRAESPAGRDDKTLAEAIESSP